MNKFLVLVVFILIPVTIVSYQEKDTVVYAETLENKELEIPITEQEVEIQVLVSKNKDKSDALELDLEEYVIGVVAGEMPASFNLEALKAQAVAARTYALYKMINNEDYILSSTISDQVYLTIEEMQAKWGNDFDYYYERVKKSVEDTKGEVITYNDEVIIAYYFAISNGYTDSGEIVFNDKEDYLVSVDSSWDLNYKSYSSTRTMSLNNFCNKLDISCDGVFITNIERASNNYVREITINGVTFTGIEVFNKLSLKSTDFTISYDNDIVTITTKGFGHGVGMSQYGAQAMAKEGYNYEEILTYYYQNTEINKFVV